MKAKLREVWQGKKRKIRDGRASFCGLESTARGSRAESQSQQQQQRRRRISTSFPTLHFPTRNQESKRTSSVLTWLATSTILKVDNSLPLSSRSSSSSWYPSHGHCSPLRPRLLVAKAGSMLEGKRSRASRLSIHGSKSARRRSSSSLAGPSQPT